ncbi:MAG: PDDEXK nuclease domain-containing protein [Bacteroidales bacterium]|nr:PDDEXK nuclease domain-containing protein [Bacteroidales bacterium]
MEQNKALCDIEHKDYAEILQHAVAVIEHARIETAKHVNINVASAYWEIGKLLHERKIESGHGDRVVKRLSEDLKERYPKMGVSPRQLWNMKKFFQRYDGHDEKVLRSVALLPWSHNLLLLSKGLNDDATLYYSQETIEKGWNRDLLLNAIKMKMYESQLETRVDNNFERTLPAKQACYANEVFSSSYNLGFLGVTSPILELELEDRLVKAITRFLMELGNGFTFIGNQHVLEYYGKESKVDMLFFHRGLRCLVAIDLRGSQQTGVLVSKVAARFKPLAVNILAQGDENAVHWFLEDKTDVRSSNYLEDAATEIQVQGLELDFVCVLWDADMRYIDGHWEFFKFNGKNKWTPVADTPNGQEEKKYMLNAYRVLLTRARQGIVICVPKGNSRLTPEGFPEDPTRLPAFYNGTYAYLKSLGIEEI